MQISSDVLQTVPACLSRIPAALFQSTENESNLSRNRRYDLLHAVHINSAFRHKNTVRNCETVLTRAFQETSKSTKGRFYWQIHKSPTVRVRLKDDLVYFPKVPSKSNQTINERRNGVRNLGNATEEVSGVSTKSQMPSDFI